MFKFNDESIFTGLLKNKLSTFNLPSCKVFKNVDEIKSYVAPFVLDLSIARDGWGFYCIVKKFDKNDDYLVYVKTGVSEDNQIQKISTITPISRYIFGNNYLNITKTFVSTNIYYDRVVHEYLGNYLRFIRDYKGVNFMSMYNCYSNNDYFYKKKYRIAIIPVDLMSSYTLCFDAKNIYYFLTSNVSDSKMYTTLLQFDNDSTLEEFYKINAISIMRPYILDFKTNTYITHDNQMSSLLSKPQYLCLVFPYDYSSRINILEGTYPNTSRNLMINNEKQNGRYLYNSTSDLSRYYSDISLLSKANINQTVNIPFADRLMGYLIGYPISQLDNISNNVIGAKRDYFLKYVLNSDGTAKQDYQLPRLNSSLTDRERINLTNVRYTNQLLNLDNNDNIYQIDKDVEFALNDERYPDFLIDKKSKENI